MKTRVLESLFDKVADLQTTYSGEAQTSCAFYWFVLLLASLLHCVKSVRIRSYSDPYFPAFGQNTERYGPSLCIQSKCGKMRTRITPNTDTFYAVPCFNYNL